MEEEQTPHNLTKDEVRSVVKDEILTKDDIRSVVHSEVVTKADIKSAIQAEILTPSDIKSAVSASLLEALGVAQTKVKDEKYGFNNVLNTLNQLLPFALLALMGWSLLTTVQVQKDIALTQKDIVAMRVEIGGFGNELVQHASEGSDRDATSGAIHHTKSKASCDGCHFSSATSEKTLYGYSELNKTKQKVKVNN